jgi:FAD/FMN-containing dehydrogenase
MLEKRIPRRSFVRGAFVFLISPSLLQSAVAKASINQQMITLHDRHSMLERCDVAAKQFYLPQSKNALTSALREIRRSPSYTAICGAQHAGGGQQYAEGGALIDTTKLSRVLDFDERAGLLQVEPGIRWPALLEWLARNESQWTVRQKQTGFDNLTLGGALSANAHGQGLMFKPLINDVESFRLMLADGSGHECSRSSQTELFRLVIGGYGNFGLITAVTLRLMPRLKYRREVEALKVADIPERHRHCVSAGATYGDFQCNIDETSDGFLRDGVFSCYMPEKSSLPVRSTKPIDRDGWLGLATSAHTQKAAAFEQFKRYHLSTSGSVDWPERWQSSVYVDNYHAFIDKATGAKHSGSEVLTELYVPLKAVSAFMESVRADFLENKVNLIYSTVRFIEKDTESYLPWARAQSACIIFNLHCEHSSEGIEHTKSALIRLIDHAIKYGGRYYLTYHRFARKDQVLACYPEMPEFLKLKRRYDPTELFRSNWYRHYSAMFA